MYSRDLIEAVLRSSDIVTVTSSFLHVEKKGRNYVALCPFHDDKNPSLSISKDKQIFKCFVCGTGGDSIGFVQKFLKVPYPEAVRKVAEISNFSDPRLVEDAPKLFVDPGIQRLYSCIDDLQLLYKYALSTEEAGKARDYLAKRNLGEDMVETFALGYAPLDGVKTIEYLRAKGHSLKEIEDIGIAFARSEGTADHNAGRLIFPLFNPRGQLVGFSARQLEKDGSAKYINSPETPIFHKGENLYNYHRIASSAHRDGYCYLVEGFMDVMSCHRAGITNAVALMGTALTKEQVQLLKRLKCEIRLCLDGDAPGQAAMIKNSQLLSKSGVAHRIVDYQGDLRDPDDIYNEDGKEALLKRLNVLLEPMDYYLAYYSASASTRSVEQRKSILNAFLPYLRSQKQGIEYEEALVKLSKATGYSADAIRNIASSSVSEEEETYTQLVTAKTPNLRKQKLSRLQSAEKNLLYYMLKDPKAIEIYQSMVGTFYDDKYRNAANYVIDYVLQHPGEPVDIPLICSVASSDGNDEIASQLADLALEKTHEPATKELLERYANTIANEKRNTRNVMELEQSMQTGDEVAAMEQLQALIEAKRKQLKK